MKLTKTVSELKVVQEVPGLLSVSFEHAIKETKGELKYDGPKISPEVWHSILSFFRWTYETTKSESQVRLFVNPVEKLWDAWAFPQEARTGMTAHELDTDDTKKQRAMFPEPWVYFGTVHHHCASTAFQSGVDEHNEKDQLGLHITIGKIDEKQHDMHARFYVKGCCFDPDMSLLWDVGPEVVDMMPPQLHDVIARWQMCHVVDQKFPDQWKENLIEKKTVGFTGSTTYPSGGYYGGTYGGNGGEWQYVDGEMVKVITDRRGKKHYIKGSHTYRGYQQNRFERCETAAEEFFREALEDPTVTVAMVKDTLDALMDMTHPVNVLRDLAKAYDLDIDELVREVDAQMRKGLSDSGVLSLPAPKKEEPEAEKDTTTKVEATPATPAADADDQMYSGCD